MLRLEQRLQQRYPRWFQGRRGGVSRPMLRALSRWSRLDDLDRFLQDKGHLRGFDFIGASLDFLGARYEVDPAQLARVPARGGLVVVANHPSGALDALALLDALGRVRRDVRIVANDVLSLVAPLQDLLLPVRLFGGGAAAGSVRAMERALLDGQCLVVFPAGEVSRIGLRGIRDGRWRNGFARLARGAGVPVLPVRIGARNSALFYGASVVYKPAATALLAREMFERRARPLRLHVGEPMRVAADGDAAEQARRVREAMDALGRDKAPGMAPLARPGRRVAIAREIARAEPLGETADGKRILLASLPAGSTLLHEIGRLRELAFRRVGEGTGRRRDLDAFDPHYQHVLVWDASEARIAGAYRMARGARVLAERGLGGLYTASLFRYSGDAIPRLAEGMELGRSFVAPEYRGCRSLDYLWQGIGAYLCRHPDVRYLYGAVSISAALPRAAREQIVAYYQRYYAHPQDLAASLRPFAYFAAPPCYGELEADTAFDLLRANLASLGTAVPVLYRQYTELCEPGGARFLAFGVDPDFSDSIDGLIEVDLRRLHARKRRRYLEPREAA